MASSVDTTLHIYTRVSTLVQADKGTSLQSQLELGQKKAEELGFSYQHWDEGGKSSHHEEIADRPVLANLYQAISKGLVKHLWVYDQSRLSRNDQVASIFRYECNKRGVTLYTKGGQFDLSSPQDQLLKQLLDAIAQFDNTTRADRTRMGKLQRVRSGFWHGGPPPFGYRLLDRKLDVEPTEAKWVAQMFKLSAGGASPAQIKQELDANGVTARRGGLWTIGSIAAMLKNQHYTGQYLFQDKKSGESIPVICPGIVDQSTWEAVQVLHRLGESRQQQRNATIKHFYLIRDLLFCGHCGRPISGRQVRGNGEALYYCPNKERAWVQNGGKSEAPWKRGTGCGFSRSMNLDRTEELVWKCVRDMHAQSSHLKEEVKRRVLEQQGLQFITDKNARKQAEAKYRRLQKDSSALSKTIGDVTANHLLNQLDAVSYQATLKRLNDERDRLQGLMAELKLQLHAETARKKWIDWVDQFGSEVQNTATFTDEQSKAYVAGIVERIDAKWLEEKNAHELTIHFRLPIVGDGIEWLHKEHKSKGYKLVDGSRTTTLPLSKRAARTKNTGTV